MRVMMRTAIAIVLVGCGASRSPAPPPAFDPKPVVIAGRFDGDRAPDGNSVVLDAPRGLIVVDTGRHRAHQDKLLAHAKAVGKPIIAIVNTHWHLDHSGGNAEIKAVYPGAEIVTSNAIDRAYVEFFAKNRRKSLEYLASGKATPQQVEDIKLDHAAVDDPQHGLRPTRPVTASAMIELGGRTLDVRVAPYAATEADVWLYEDATKTVIAGDLVVAPVPFFDTACAAGWLAALDAIAATPFVTLVPGHGEPMTRAAFMTWKTAFERFVDCAASDQAPAACAAGWRRDAGPPADPQIDEYAAYYVEDVLRSASAQERFCQPPAR